MSSGRERQGWVAKSRVTKSMEAGNRGTHTLSCSRHGPPLAGASGTANSHSGQADREAPPTGVPAISPLEQQSQRHNAASPSSKRRWPKPSPDRSPPPLCRHARKNNHTPGQRAHQPPRSPSAALDPDKISTTGQISTCN